jgi:hypothetical protein
MQLSPRKAAERTRKRKEIGIYAEAHPGTCQKVLAIKFDVSQQQVSIALRQHGIRTRKVRKDAMTVKPDSFVQCFICLHIVDKRTGWKLCNRYAHPMCVKIIAESVVEQVEMKRAKELHGKAPG